MTDARLVAARGEINTIDLELLDVLNRRAKIAQEVGQIKRESGVKGYLDASREAEVLKLMRQANDGPLTDGDLDKIYTAIMDACRDLQARR